MNTCRFCKEVGKPLFRFGVRHYCHAECGLAKWGIEFLNKIPRHEVIALPYFALKAVPGALDKARELNK